MASDSEDKSGRGKRRVTARFHSDYDYNVGEEEDEDHASINSQDMNVDGDSNDAVGDGFAGNLAESPSSPLPPAPIDDDQETDFGDNVYDSVMGYEEDICGQDPRVSLGGGVYDDAYGMHQHQVDQSHHDGADDGALDDLDGHTDDHVLEGGEQDEDAGMEGFDTSAFMQDNTTRNNQAGRHMSRQEQGSSYEDTERQRGEAGDNTTDDQVGDGELSEDQDGDEDLEEEEEENELGDETNRL